MPEFRFRFDRGQLNPSAPMTLSGVTEVFRPVIRLLVYNSSFTSKAFPINALIDTGSDWCLFPDWLAHRLKMDLADSRPLSIRSATDSMVVKVNDVGLELLQGPNRFRWQSTVGFVPYQLPLFADRRLAGILGHYGGLDQFETSFDWCGGLPQIRMTNCLPSLPIA